MIVWCICCCVTKQSGSHREIVEKLFSLIQLSRKEERRRRRGKLEPGLELNCFPFFAYKFRPRPRLEYQEEDGSTVVVLCIEQNGK